MWLASASKAVASPAQHESVMGSDERLVETDKVLEAVKAFRKVRDYELGQNDKKSIIDVDERQNRGVHLQLTVKKMSACQKILMIPYVFPHCLVGEDDEVCFIVGCKESEKGNKRLVYSIGLHICRDGDLLNKVL